MSDRVSATITIGGLVPAARLNDLLDAIEAEDLGPDWDVRFDSRDDILAHLVNGAAGAFFCRLEVASGEFEDLQAACVEIGLSYVLTYGGSGGQWGPGRRIWRPGDAGYGLTCSLNAEDGYACASANDIRGWGFVDLQQVLERLALFDDPHVPPLEIEGQSSVGAGDAP